MRQLPLVWARSGISFQVIASTWDPACIRAIRSHYTGSAGPPPGKKMAWEIFEDGAHRGWIMLGEPAFKLAPRRRLGLTDARPAPATVGCSLFRIRPGRIKASRVLRLWHEVCGVDWCRRYGFVPAHFETMCMDRGACFRRAGYRRLGWTTGRSARRPPGATHGPRVWGDSDPKLVLYRGPLHRVCP